MATPLVREAIRRPGVLRADAAEELGEQQNAAANAGENLAGKQQADHARNTFGNFFAELLLSAYRLVRSAPSVGRGEGGFVSKEIVSGAYRAVARR